MSQNYDITGKLIREGDWLIIPGTSSQMAPLRFAKVLGFGSTGKPRIGAFEIRDRSDYEWTRYPIKPITLTIAEKSFIVDPAALPDGLVKYIAEELDGDTERLEKRHKELQHLVLSVVANQSGDTVLSDDFDKLEDA